MNKIKIITFLLIFSTFGIFAQRNQQNNSENEQMKYTIHLTKAEFLERVMNFEKNPTEWIYLGDKPIIVNFYATWCGPCRMIAPILEELAEQYKGQIYIYKIDTDRERELAAVFGVRSLPTTLFVPMNGAPQMAQGALSKEAFVRAIEEVLLKSK